MKFVGRRRKQNSWFPELSTGIDEHLDLGAGICTFQNCLPNVMVWGLLRWLENQPISQTENQTPFQTFPSSSGSHTEHVSTSEGAFFELQWVTWKCTPAHHYFVQKAMLFRDAGLCGLLTPGAGGPAACGTSPLLGTPVAKPISKFLALVGLHVVWCSPSRKINT